LAINKSGERNALAVSSASGEHSLQRSNADRSGRAQIISSWRPTRRCHFLGPDGCWRAEGQWLWLAVRRVDSQLRPLLAQASVFGKTKPSIEQSICPSAYWCVVGNV